MNRILILGANFESIPTIREAKKRYKIILVDKNKNSPGFNYADYKIYESIYDFKTIISKIQNININKISGVVAAGTDVPITVHKINKFLKIKTYSLKTANFFSNKYLMKKELKKKGINVPWFTKIQKEKEIYFYLKKKKKFILKPCDNRGSRGVFIINQNTKNISELFMKSKSFTNLKYLILEEFIEGQQFSTESLIYYNQTFTPGFCRRNYNDTRKFYPNIIENGGDQPVGISRFLKKKISDTAIKAGKALGLKFGVIKGDMVLNKENNKPYVIEVACRLSGGWFSSHQIPHATGFNLIKKAIEIACQKKINLNNLSIKFQKAVGIRYFFPKFGILNKISISKNLYKRKSLIMIKILKKKGDIIKKFDSHPDRVGFVILKKDNKQDLIKELNYFKKNIKFKIL